VAEFVLDHMSWFLRGNTWPHLEDRDAVQESLQKELGPGGCIGDLEIFEQENIFAVLGPNRYSGAGFALRGNFWKKLNPADIPPCLRR
jgi:hypothetical protein